MTHDTAGARTKSEFGFFELLERQMMTLDPPVGTSFRRDLLLWVSITVGLLLVTLPVARLLGQTVGLISTVTGLCLQMVGLALLAYRQARDVVPDFIDASRKYAMELDRDLAHRAVVIAWLRIRPFSVRAEHLRFARLRLKNIRSRYPLVFGPVDKLGFLPAVVAVFVQLQAVKSFSALAMIGAIFIVALYAMSLWMTRYRIQLERYVHLLEDAQEDLTAESIGPLAEESK